MTLLLSMPGGGEFIIIISVFLIVIFVIASPILAIVFYSQNKKLKKQVAQLNLENKELLKRF